TQETFARFFRTLPNYQHYGKAANYLYVIAGNCCRDHCRRHRELPLEELPEQAMEGPEQTIEVRMALAKLPGELRETAVLYFIQELKQTEIARILGISLPLVKYRIRRAKALLAAELGKEEPE
ncbi:MAG: RNA polymerase sigma factor, partial [Faecousia sp.]